MKNLFNIGLVLVFIYLMFNLFVFALPVILVFFVIRVLLSILGVKKQSTKKNYYYRYGGQDTQDFNEFFRNNGFGGQQSRQGYGSYNGNAFGSSPYFEDKSKYYTVLGVPKEATQEDIKKAYRNKARECHPDKHSQSSENIKLEAEKRFKEINEAYEKLKD